MGVAGAKAAGSKLRASVPIAGCYLQRFGAALIAALPTCGRCCARSPGSSSDYLGPMLAPVGRVLRQPSVRMPLLIAGVVALLGGIIRAFANGFERDTWIALLIGVVHARRAGCSRISRNGMPAWLSARAAVAARRTARAPRRRHRQAAWCKACSHWSCLAYLPPAPLRHGAPLPAALLPRRACRARNGAKPHARKRGWPLPAVISKGVAPPSPATRCASVATTVRLTGIEAPEPDQTCTDADGSEWSCGRAARQALSGLLRTGRVVCDVSERCGAAKQRRLQNWRCRRRRRARTRRPRVRNQRTICLLWRH